MDSGSRVQVPKWFLVVSGLGFTVSSGPGRNIMAPRTPSEPTLNPQPLPGPPKVCKIMALMAINRGL